MGWFRSTQAKLMKVEFDEEPLKLRIGKLNLKPGDVVVMRTEMVLNKEECIALRDLVTPYFPNNKVMIITCGLQIGVVSNGSMTMMEKDNLE